VSEDYWNSGRGLPQSKGGTRILENVALLRVVGRKTHVLEPLSKMAFDVWFSGIIAPRAHAIPLSENWQSLLDVVMDPKNKRYPITLHITIPWLGEWNAGRTRGERVFYRNFQRAMRRRGIGKVA